MCPVVVCVGGVRILCVVYSMLCVCVIKLAACTGDSAQRLWSSHGVAGCLRREHDNRLFFMPFAKVSPV